MKKNKKMKKEASKKDSLTYFLDHPEIHREECVGNGNAPGSIASQINFGGKGTAAPPPAPTSAPTTAEAKPSIASQINFGGKYK